MAKIRKLLSYIVIALAGVGTVAGLSIGSASAETVTIVRKRMDSNTFKSGGRHGVYYYNNEPIYCVQPNDAAIHTGRYNREKRSTRNVLLRKVLYYGYDGPGWSEGKKCFGSYTSASAAYEATHWMAAYAFYNGYEELKSQAAAQNADSMPAAVRTIYNKIQDLDEPNYSLTFNKDSVRAKNTDIVTISGKQYWKTPTVKVSGKGDDGYFTLKSNSDVSIHVGNKTASNGDTIKVYAGDSIYFTAPVSFHGRWDSGNLKSGEKWTLYVYNTDTPYQEMASLENKPTTDKLSASFPKQTFGKAHVIKKSTTNEKVAGVRFKIHQVGGDRDDDETKPTNANGEVDFTITDDGTYTITEKSAPFPYKVDPTPQQVTFSEADLTNQVTKNVNFTDTKMTGYLKVHKTSTSGPTTDNMTASFDVLYGGKVVNSFTTDAAGNGGCAVELRDNPTTHYVLKETKAPANYQIVESEIPVSVTADSSQDVSYAYRNTDFTGADDGPDENYAVEVPNQPTTIDAHIYKRNTANQPIQGAVFGVYRSSDNALVTQVTTDPNGYAVASNLVKDNYYIKEISVPANYVKSATTVSVPGVSTTATFVEKRVFVNKVDVNGNPVSGAQMQILEGSTVKDSWTSDGTAHEAQNLEGGHDYTLREVKAPDGFVVMKDVSFHVDDNTTDQTVTAVDKRIFVNKKDTKGNLVAGAELRVVDAAGHECDRWTTTADGDGYHAISNLAEGQTYTVEEVKAPNGFVRAKPISFEVSLDKVDQYYTMVDKRYFLRKVDVDGRLLDNVHAKLAVVKRGDDPKDASKVLDTWYTDDKNAIIQDGDNKGYHAVSGLEEGGQYTVYEVETPKGYVTFKPEDFDVTEEKVDQWRTVIDKRVGVTKTDIGTKTLKDAHLQVIDANNRNVICDQWVTDDSGFWWVSGLEEDHDYILVETKAPYNYVIATEIPFRVTHDSNEKKNNQFLTMKDKQVHVKKQDLGGQEVPGAKMCVIDNDDNNRVVYSWTSGNKETIVQYLREGHHYTFHEEASPDGYVVATDLKFYVNDYKINETYKVTDKRVRALKTDVNHENPIEGAKLSVIDKDSGKTVDTWRTTKDFHYVNNLIEGKTYIMREEEAPKGYVRANDVIFTVSRAKETQSVYMVDKRVKISKKGVKVDSEVEGAKMAIYKSEDGKITDDVAVDTWTTTKDPHYADGLSEGHEYTLVELRAPEGYVKAKPITFIATAASEDGIKADQLEVMIDKRFQVSKTDVTGKKEVPGAHLAVTDAKTGKLIKEWVSTTKPYYVSGLEEGRTYILSETRAPKGYAVAESVQFYITEEKVDQKCIMKDKQISVTKTDITGTKEVPGAKLEVIDKDTKKTVDQWISGSKKHYVDNLKENHDYILKETRAPKGYVKAEQVEFRVTGEKVNQKHIMKDKQVTVTKTDITGGKEVPGAHLTVTDKKTGRKVDSWISTEKPHNVSGLEEKHTYILTEKLAPKGYVKAESVEFYVSNAKINQKHLMKDKRVFITKTDITTGKELPGAHLSVTDKKTGKVVDRWVSGYHPHAVSGLKEGRRYILKEVTAPNGYLKAESIEFLVTKDKVNQKHVMKDRPYAPKTGDETDTTPYIIGAGGAVAVIAAAVIISIIRKKKQK